MKVANERTNERTNGESVSASYLATLVDLAKKRSELGAAIITVARVAGVDPAPYLGFQSGAVEVTGSLKIEHKPDPPRPQRPASPSTNGTRANKVEAKHAAKQGLILDALKKVLRPVTPGELAKHLKWSPPTLRRHIQPLVDKGTVKAEGVTSGRTFSLA